LIANKIGLCSKMHISLIEKLRKYIQTYKMYHKIKHIKCFSRFVYDQLESKTAEPYYSDASIIIF
jgi:hypothetical protein